MHDPNPVQVVIQAAGIWAGVSLAAAGFGLAALRDPARTAHDAGRERGFVVGALVGLGGLSAMWFLDHELGPSPAPYSMPAVVVELAPWMAVAMCSMLVLRSIFLLMFSRRRRRHACLLLGTVTTVAVAVAVSTGAGPGEPGTVNIPMVVTARIMTLVCVGLVLLRLAQVAVARVRRRCVAGRRPPAPLQQAFAPVLTPVTAGAAPVAAAPTSQAGLSALHSYPREILERAAGDSVTLVVRGLPRNCYRRSCRSAGELAVVLLHHEHATDYQEMIEVVSGPPLAYARSLLERAGHPIVSLLKHRTSAAAGRYMSNGCGRCDTIFGGSHLSDMLNDVYVAGSLGALPIPLCVRLR